MCTARKKKKTLASSSQLYGARKERVGKGVEREKDGEGKKAREAKGGGETGKIGLPAWTQEC